MAIPLNTPLRLELTSHKLQLADDKNVPLGPNSNAIQVQHQGGPGDLNLTFHITGTK